MFALGLCQSFKFILDSSGIKTIGVTSVQIASFFAHGNEAMKAGETSEQAYAKAQSNLKELKQVRSFTNNVKGIVKLSNAIAKSIENIGCFDKCNG